MTFQVFTGNSNGHDCMPLFLDSPTSPANSDNTFSDMVEKYIDLTECQYDTVLPTTPLPDKSCSSQTGLQTTNLLGRLPWHTCLADMFESSLGFIKEATAALQKDFSNSLQQSDENSRAYCAVLRGEIPLNSSSRSYTHVSSRLLLIRFLDICCKTVESDETSKDAAHPQVALSGLDSIGLLDWVDTLKKADALLKSSTGGHRADNGVELTITLSTDQLKSRELYIYSEKSERKSTLSQIYANIDHPQGSEVDDEFGGGLSPPSYGWASLLRTLELAIATGPLILFDGKKLSNNRIARFRLTTLWVQRGNATDHSVWSAEKIIWQGLIKIALGKASIEAGVAGIAEMIRKVAYGYVSPAARSWYNLRDHTLEKSREASEDDFFKFLHMWPLPALSQMPIPLPTLASTLSKTTMDLPTLTTISTTALTGAPTQPLSPEAHKDSAPALDKVSPAELEDIKMRFDSFLSITPMLLDSDHQSPDSPPQPEEEPEEVKQPPPYYDLDRMEIDDTSQVPSAQSPLGGHTEIETIAHDPLSTQANDPHQETKSPRTGKRPLPSPASPWLSTDAGVDEGMAPRSEKRPRLTAQNRDPTSRRFNHSRPQASHSQGTSLGKKAVKSRPHRTGPLLQASAFDVMKEVVMRDLTKEYNPPIHNIEGLDTQSNPQKVQGQQSTSFQIPGSKDRYNWAPSFHFQNDLNLFYRIYEASIKSSVHPNVTTLTYNEYKLLDTDALLEMIRRSHVVLTDCPVVSRNFDESGLVRLGALEKKITVHDHSVSEALPNKRNKSGTLLQIFRTSSHPDAKALNALDFTKSKPAEIDLRFSTDSIAWDQVQGEEWCTDSYPTTSVRWGICATAGAYQGPHFERDGFGTFVYPESGANIWMVGVPKEGKSFDDLANLDTLLSEESSLGCASSCIVNWVPLMLIPGTALIMRPNTLHAVFTTEHSVCMGGRYISTSTLRDTCYGIFQSFVTRKSLTGDGRVREAFMLLARIVAFYSTSLMSSEADGLHRYETGLDKDDPRYHLPDLTSFDGILDISSLFCILELGNALSPWAYGERDNVEHRRLIYTRKRARILRHWIFSRHHLLDESGDLVDYKRAFYWPYLVQQAKALVQGIQSNDAGHRGFKEGDIDTAVRNTVEQSLQHCEELWNIYNENGDFPTSFSWKGQRFQVRKVKDPLTVEDDSDHEEGFNLGDRHAFNLHAVINPVAHG